ncbi:MAG: hypothetical protein IJC46_00760 [Clostridia bacterium]|nr:hypothetical protein [Clostridia bacterium]
MKLLKFFFKYYVFRSLRKVQNIEAVIESHGFRVYRYRPEESSSQVAGLLRDLDCVDYARHHNSFHTANPIIKGVFIRRGLSLEDQRELLFHEEAHIWYNHPYTVSFTEETEIRQEVVANRFLARLKMLKVVFYTLVVALLACGILLTAKACAQSDGVYVTASGDCYHQEDCPQIAGNESATAIELSQAQHLDKRPCKICRP